MKPDETTPNKIGQFLREPVAAEPTNECVHCGLEIRQAGSYGLIHRSTGHETCRKREGPTTTATLPACLCGLDTNPVTSPRMDIHCPKHDAPEAVGEPELPHEVTIVGCPHQPLSLWPPTCVVQHVDNELQVATYTRVSQPAGEPSDGPLLTREQYQEQCKRPFYPGRDIHRYVGSKAPGQACETCDLSWVHENHGRMISTVAAAQPASTPADEVAQRARTAAEEICNLSAASEGCCVCFQSEEILAIITKHFTGGAFNEESKKCSKCEEPPVMERDGVVWLLRCLTCGKVRSSAWGKDDLVKRWNEAQRVSEIKQ